jgi:MoaA/NifB/PqqE/SkfB family radical SAM enzyme
MSVQNKIRKHLHRIKRLIGVEELKLLIDVSSCNLKCALCPRGGVAASSDESKGLMGLDLFRRIIDKFKKEKVRIKEIEIGNWGEPLLNRDLPAMIRYVRDTWPPRLGGRAGSIGISTNLNFLADPEELMVSGVDRIRVSISGMTQDVYSRNHIGGDIGRVLENILRLAAVKRENGLSRVSIGIGFHDLKYNKKDAELARRFCERNGLAFTLLPMYISSVDENIRFHEDGERLSKFYGAFFDIDREVGMMKRAKSVKKCQFRRSTITVNFDAQVCRCCGVFAGQYMMGPIFDYRIREIPKMESAICYKCATTPMSWR